MKEATLARYCVLWSIHEYRSLRLWDVKTNTWCGPTDNWVPFETLFKYTNFEDDKVKHCRFPYIKELSTVLFPVIIFENDLEILNVKTELKKKFDSNLGKSS